MGVDRSALHSDPSAFFRHGGSAWLKLTPVAAKSVCAQAASHGLVVVRVEGGLWRNPGFEARVDCIWDGADPPLSLEDAELNNSKAMCDIEREEATHSAFIITTAPLGGYRAT
jgi:hypothetical protein